MSFWVSFAFIILFWFGSLIMMLLPGPLPKFLAIPMSIFELPLIAGKESILTENPLSWQTVSIPALDQLYGYIFFLMWIFIAYANFMDEIGRDIRYRKKKLQK